MSRFTLAHLSDPHVIDWQGAGPALYLGKRLTGWANFRFARRRSLRLEVLEALLDDVAERAPDHVAVTGDLTSLAFARELRDFAELLERRGLGPDRVSIVPGNHDAYTRAAWRGGLFGRELARYMTSDLHGGAPAFPFCRLRGPVAVVGLSSAVARPTFMAGGLVGEGQARRLVDVLSARAVRERLAAVLLHHPPVLYRRLAKELQSGLHDRPRVLAALREGLAGRPGLVLSGHWHERRRVRLDLPGDVWLLQAPSASHLGGGPAREAAYHLIEVDGEAEGAPRVAGVEVRGYEPGEGRVVTIERYLGTV